MAKYLVGLPELHYSWREVEAEDEEDAEAKAYDSEEKYLEYEATVNDSYEVIFKKCYI